MAEDENDEEIEVIDVSLSEREIDEMIAQLMELKEHKESVQIPIAADLDLLVNYHEGEDSNEEVEEDEGDDGDDSDDDEGEDDGEDKVEESKE